MSAVDFVAIEPGQIWRARVMRDGRSRIFIRVVGIRFVEGRTLIRVIPLGGNRETEMRTTTLARHYGLVTDREIARALTGVPALDVERIRQLPDDQLRRLANGEPAYQVVPSDPS